MWLSYNKVDIVNQKEQCFNDLIEECKYAAPGARLSYNIRNRLEKFPIEIRREIVNKVKAGCAPLFISCKRGHVEIAEYLITVCNADIEQRGIYEVPDDRSVHSVTPLWCAAVSGKLSVIRCLAHHGADINAVSDTGSTPVRSACFMTHLEIVQFLVENGADIRKANYNGGTCLINSVQSVQLCKFLLKHGADVNARDIQNKTALHYAIQEHRLETTKLLLDHGADTNAKSRYGDDALQTACLKGATNIFEYLIAYREFSPERLANGYELLGSSHVDEHNNVFTAIDHWRVAQYIRETHGLLPKEPKMPLRSAFRYETEFLTTEELENISADLDAIRIQSLLITERILGPNHKDTVFRLMYRGASYADAMRYHRCIDLWRRALEIRVEKDTILYSDTCFTAQALVRLMIDLKQKTANGNIYMDENQLFTDIIATFHLLSDNIMEARQLLDIKPTYKRQMDSYDRILKCITHLIYIMIECTKTNEQRQLVTELVTNLVRMNPRSSSTGDTLLHLCVSRLNTIKSNYFMDDNQVYIFPRHEVIKLLLDCGANVNARNETKSTPLHVASVVYNFRCSLVKMLLDYGAHIDQPNSSKECPSINIAQNPLNYIHVLNYVSLKCLCATAVIKHSIPYKEQIPKTLEAFVKLHDPK